MLEIVKKNALVLCLLGFFALYHSNLREQGPPSETFDLKVINFSLLLGHGFDVYPVSKQVLEGTGLPDAGHVLDPKGTPPNKPFFTAAPFLPLYAWFMALHQPLNLFAVNFIGKFCSVIYGVLTLWALYGIGLNLGLGSRKSLLWMVCFGLSTHLWHSVSQALWSSTGFVAFFTFGLYFITKPRETLRDLRWGGFFLGYALACRFQDVVLIAPFVAYVLYRRRDRASWIWFLAPLALPMVISLGMNLVHYGSLLGTYSKTGISTQKQIQQTGIVPGLTGNWLQGLVGLLVSPSRGLWLYTPILFFPFFWLFKYHLSALRKWRKPTLLHVAAASVLLQLLLIGKYNIWWGGWSWGPRFLATSLPAFFVLFVLVLPKRLEGRLRAVVIAAVLWGCFTEGLAAYKYHYWLWNWAPKDVDLAPARLWDLEDFQLKRALTDPWYFPSKHYSLEY